MVKPVLVIYLAVLFVQVPVLDVHCQLWVVRIGTENLAVRRQVLVDEFALVVTLDAF